MQSQPAKTKLALQPSMLLPDTPQTARSMCQVIQRSTACAASPLCEISKTLRVQYSLHKATSKLAFVSPTRQDTGSRLCAGCASLDPVRASHPALHTTRLAVTEQDQRSTACAQAPAG